MRILVTGGAGYLGSILCRKLIELNHYVICYDTCLYGTQSIFDLINHENFYLAKNDIRNLVPLTTSLKDVDAVVHLASIVGMPASDIDPKSSFEINQLATESLAKMASSRGVKQFIFASSCSVYGSQPDKMITEKSDILPIDQYAKHKYQSEFLIRQGFSFPAILRFGTLFGFSSRMRFDLVVNKFIAQALNGETITVFGGGEQQRPFLHVSDAADSIIFALFKDLEGTYNVISENMSMIRLAEIISEKLGVKYEVTKENPDNRDYKVSMEKINDLGFEPQKNLEFAIHEITNFFDKNKLDWKNKKFSNYDSLLTKEIAKKAFIQ